MMEHHPKDTVTEEQRCFTSQAAVYRVTHTSRPSAQGAIMCRDLSICPVCKHCTSYRIP